MEKDNVKDCIPIVVKSLITIVPQLGAVINSVWSDIETKQIERKFARLEEFYTNLKKDLEKIKDQINQPYTSEPDFLDIFELTSRYIVNERTKEKRIIFKNILLNSMTKKIAIMTKQKNI